MATTFAWAIPALALTALPAGIVCAVLARRGLGRGRAGLAWGAAASRGAAVALALLAAARPEQVTVEANPGVVLVAASDARALDVVGADQVLRWPGTAPDAASAVETLRAAAPSDRPASLVLAWSSQHGDAPTLDAADALRSRGADTSILRPETAAPIVAVAPAPRLVLPASAVEGVDLSVTLDAGATPFTGGEAIFSIDGHEERVTLPHGARRVTTPPFSARAGAHVVAARFADRPAAAATLRIAEPPAALLVTTTGIEPAIASRLRKQGIRVTVVSETAVDLAPPTDVVVLGPGTGARSAADIASRVAAGTGLLVMGGEDARGLSRLRGTALEPLLPVELPPPPEPPAPDAPRPPEKPQPPTPDKPKPVLDEGEKQALRVALLLVIDRSGSMLGTKMAMAREAAIAAARTLDPLDRVGVIAFDEESEWIAPFQDARDMAALYRSIQLIQADGGTNFYPALKMGYAAIAREPCGIRHVILVTDGATRAAVFRDIVEGGADQGITLSSVAVGDGADTRLLGMLAQWGKGRLYPAVDPERLPQVITLDTRRFVQQPRDARKDRPDVPDVAIPDASDVPADAPPFEPPAPVPPRGAAPRLPHIAAIVPFLAGLENAAWPPLPHPESVRIAGPATVPLVWDDGTPALVLGRAGGGRCAVFAADAFSADARDLWHWFESGRVMAQLVRSLAPAPPPADAGPEIRFVALTNGRAAVLVGAPGGGVLRIRPSGGGEELRVFCRASGDASVGELAQMPAAGIWVGEYVATDAQGSSSIATASPGLPPRDDASLATELSARSGADIVDHLPARRDGAPRERRDDRSAAFLVAAAVCLVADAALRRGVRG